MSSLKKMISTSLIAGSTFFYSMFHPADLKAQENIMPLAHNSIESVLDYDINRCAVGFKHSQQKPHRAQGKLLSESGNMTDTFGLQCQYFEVLVSKNNPEEGPSSDSLLARVYFGGELDKLDKSGSIGRLFLGYGKIKYDGSDDYVNIFQMGAEIYGLIDILDVKVLGQINAKTGYREDHFARGDSFYLMGSVGHDFTLSEDLKLPVTLSIERYGVGDEAGGERHNDLFTDVGVDYEYEDEKGAGFIVRLHDKIPLNGSAELYGDLALFAKF